MKKLLSVIFLLMCVITMSAQMSHPVIIWHNGYKMTFTNIDSVTFVQTPSVPETEYVDLGLKVKWATCNLGATSPEEHGDYFAWGETKTKDRYSESSYKFWDDEKNRWTKYNDDDNKYKLESADDAASVLKGKGWRIPTKEDVMELREKCTWKEEALNDKTGVRVTGPNGQSIFIPYAGNCEGTNRVNIGSGQYGSGYWTSFIVTQEDEWVGHVAQAWRFNVSDMGISRSPRTEGYPIRPVLP